MASSYIGPVSDVVLDGSAPSWCFALTAHPRQKPLVHGPNQLQQGPPMVERDHVVADLPGLRVTKPVYSSEEQATTAMGEAIQFAMTLHPRQRPFGPLRCLARTDRVSPRHLVTGGSYPCAAQ